MNFFKRLFSNPSKTYSTGGVLKSPVDERDYKLNRLIKKENVLPRCYVQKHSPIILNQGEVGCCVGCTLAQIKHFQEKEERRDPEMFSPGYIYANRKDTDFQGSGMYPRQALANLKEYGMCHLKDFPFYSENEYEDIRDKYLQHKDHYDQISQPYHISSYYKLDTIEDIKTAIYKIGYCQICYNVYKCFYYPDAEGMVHYSPVLRGQNYGGHSVTCIGYDDDRKALLIANSWGEDFGVKGCMWVPYNYPFMEAWAAIDAVTEEELVKLN